jgi:pimeloyl-ACP methyl ester carboxylesterase
MRLKLLLPTLLLLLSSIPSATFASTTDTLKRLGGYPCPDSNFTCISLTVPLDHFAPSGKTIDVVFGVLPATGERKGMFITATGGPGYSGIATAGYDAETLPPEINEHYDLVFFDQRGIGASHALACDKAVDSYYKTDVKANTPEQETEALDTARKFALDCTTKIGVADVIDYTTRQAVEDLETFRQAIGDDKIWLYGESYGTKYAQVYTAAHPEHLAGLFLDGPIDLTLSGTEFLQQQTQAFNDVLKATLDACTNNPDCAGDVEGGDAVSAFNRLSVKLALSPRKFDFPLASGETEERYLTRDDLETTASNYLYSEASRMLLQRAVAAASHGDYVPLARAYYNAVEVDADTYESLNDQIYSSASYYAINCTDYIFPGETPDERAENYLRQGDQIDETFKHFDSSFYSFLPCVFWPGNSVSPAPAPLVAPGIPTFVLGATADPATPVQNARSIFQNLDDGYLITMEGGPHVIFNRGEPCVDDVITKFLVNGEKPASREIQCEGIIAENYVPLSPSDASAFANPLEAMRAAYREIFFLPEFLFWDEQTPRSIGCRYGGSLHIEANESGARLTLKNCAFAQGFIMTGSGIDNFKHESVVKIEVEVTGLKEGKLTLSKSADGLYLVTGTYGGEEVNLSKQV